MTHFQKMVSLIMLFFGQFKDRNSGRKLGNYTNDPIFSPTFTVFSEDTFSSAE